jgi:hypothetical protein
VKAKRPHPKFVLPARNPKAGLVSISFGNQELVVGRLKVELGEELGATTLVDELVDVLQWLARLAGQLVEPLKVLAEEP